MLTRVAQFIKIQFILVLVLSVALLALPGAAQASLLCRSDPTVLLSNGMALDLSAYISSYVWQVKAAHYELHVPSGVSLVAVIQTPTWLTSQETFSIYADQHPGDYTTITTVHTTLGNASVVAQTVLLAATDLALGSSSVSGLEGQSLALSFKV